MVKVCIISYAGIVSTGAVSYPVYVTGKDAPPSDVASLSASLNPSDLTKIYLSWPPVDDIDFTQYPNREGTTIITTIIENLAQITTYTYTAAEDRLHSFTVKAVDNSGNESTTPAVADMITIVHPATPTGFTALQNRDVPFFIGTGTARPTLGADESGRARFLTTVCWSRPA